MKKTYKKLLSSILAAGMIVNIASFPVFAGITVPNQKIAQTTDKNTNEKISHPLTSVNEEIRIENKNAIQNYTTEEGTVHTIYWAKGIQPPKMSGVPGSDGLYGDFQKQVDPGKDCDYITYQAAPLMNHGYYDLNKTVLDNRCYLASATNLLYWWMEQNKPYIDQYIGELNSGNKFLQTDGLVPLPDANRWDELRTAPEITAYNGMYSQRLDESNMIKNSGPFAFNYNLRTPGYYMDMVFDFFINGYPAINGDEPPTNTPDRFTKDPLGGYFHPVFGVEPLSQRIYEKSFSFYNKNFKKWILEGNGVSIGYLTGIRGHAITLWGAEYDENDRLCRIYVTDSDDYENIMNKNYTRGIHSFNTNEDANGNLHMGNSSRPDLYPGAYIYHVSTLDLKQDVWEAVTNDTAPAPGQPSILTQPLGRSYGKNASADPLQVTALIPKKDQDKGAYLTYQWYRSEDKQLPGTPIPEAVNPVYTPLIGDTAKTEYYYCEISNNKYGHQETVQTDRAEIITLDTPFVNAEKPFLIADIGYSKKTYAKGQIDFPLKILAESTDGGTLTYQWYQNTTASKNGTPVPGATAATFMPPTNETGEHFYYYCEITNTNPEASGTRSASITTKVQQIEVIAYPEQADLRITNIPKNPVLGQTYLAQAEGGTGNGAVTWSIRDGSEFASIDPGSGELTITGVGTFTILGTKYPVGNYAPKSALLKVTSVPAKEKLSLADGTLTLSTKDFTYDGTEKLPEISLTVDGKKVPAETYEISYTIEKNTVSPVNAGTYTLTVTALENPDYTGSISSTFQILPAPLHITGAILDTKIYDGTKTAAVTDVSFDYPEKGQRLESGSGYLVDKAEFTDPNAGNGNKTVELSVSLVNPNGNYVLESGNYLLNGQTIEKSASPKAPSLSGNYEISSTNPKTFVYRITPVEGAEYAMDHGDWQSSPVFDEIQPESSHIFHIRMKETENTHAGITADSETILFEKLENPAVPSLDYSIYENPDGSCTVEIAPVQGAEYSFDGGNTFQEDPVLTGLTGNETISLAIRYTSTETFVESASTSLDIQIRHKNQEMLQIKTIGDKTYGDPAFSLATTGGSGKGNVTFKSSDNNILEISGNTAKIQQAGTVTITATKDAQGIYNPASASLTLKIKKAALTVTADDITISSDTQDIPFTTTITGLVGDDTFEHAVCKIEENIAKPGTYKITVSEGTFTKGRKENYTITYHPGTLTVLPAPTTAPTTTPTATPTSVPTIEPTVVPTVEPTAVPTATPTVEPTSQPTVVPTSTPTNIPTVSPTVAPTLQPTVAPTIAPTVQPTAIPTVAPTSIPTVSPTVVPTITPTVGPTVIPTRTPSMLPTPGTGTVIPSKPIVPSNKLPENTAGNHAVNTGDKTQTSFPLTLSVLSLGSIAVLFKKRKTQ